jgi:hypothetical protein
MEPTESRADHLRTEAVRVLAQRRLGEALSPKDARELLAIGGTVTGALQELAAQLRRLYPNHTNLEERSSHPVREHTVSQIEYWNAISASGVKLQARLTGDTSTATGASEARPRRDTKRASDYVLGTCATIVSITLVATLAVANSASSLVSANAIGVVLVSLACAYSHLKAGASIHMKRETAIAIGAVTVASAWSLLIAAPFSGLASWAGGEHGPELVVFFAVWITVETWILSRRLITTVGRHC